jgi:hypothetical protein
MAKVNAPHFAPTNRAAWKSLHKQALEAACTAALIRARRTWRCRSTPSGHFLTDAFADTVALVDRSERETGEVTSLGSVSVFAGFRFPPEVVSVAVRWYLRYGLSYRDVEELLAERAVTVDHVTIYRWVQRFTPEFIEAARPCHHAPADRWFVDETYVKMAGKWVYLYRAIDQNGQVIGVLLSRWRDLAAAPRVLTRALRAGTSRPRSLQTVPLSTHGSPTSWSPRRCTP